MTNSHYSCSNGTVYRPHFYSFELQPCKDEEIFYKGIIAFRSLFSITCHLQDTGKSTNCNRRYECYYQHQRSRTY